MTLPLPDWLGDQQRERLRKQHEELLRAHEWWSHMKPIRRLLLLLARRFTSYNEAIASSEDTHCFIECVCGENFSIGDAWIKWCPKCGRGYSTAFIVYCYPPILKRREPKTKEQEDG